ncbi:hypothetical protein J3Q64DRAFT_1640896, partial [Phycomyces blakesleeanus]
LIAKLGSLGWILNLKKLSLKLSQQLENFDYLLETQTMTIKLSGTKLCNLYQLIHQHITSVSPIFPSDLQPFHENSDHNNWSVSSCALGTHMVYRYWAHKKANISINWCEMKAVQLALLTFPFLWDTSVLIYISNTISMAYLNKQGNSRAFHLMQLIIKFWRWCLHSSL